MTETMQDAVQPGLVETVAERAHVGDIMEKMHVSRATVIDVALFGTIGFLAGFLIKKYNNFITTLLLVAVGLFLAQQFELVTLSINWVGIQKMAGLEGDIDMSGAPLSMIMELLLSNMAGTISAIVGFLLGLKMG
ncbi:MAG TPA: hypothetical protein VEK38_03905 [Candidatus Bathyarchaeia archaeon]|nr:hypothetical protein [Candidatus Bathyarchaeia archaeon]